MTARAKFNRLKRFSKPKQRSRSKIKNKFIFYL